MAIAENFKVDNKPRLKFIDMARSLAIILMLEGHFVDHTLSVQFRSPDPLFENSAYFWYDVWLTVRGYTSPMFLTMTGLVFTYLLYFKRNDPFKENKRVSKGLRRVVELIFWGYLLSPNSFHVLQCIGFGILGIILIFGLYKLIKVIPLWFYFFALSTFLFSMYSYMKTHYLMPDGTTKIAWPLNAPTFIQVMFWAPKGSLFPFIHNLGYTYLGAGVGVLLHTKLMTNYRWSIPAIFGSIGLILVLFSTSILTGIKDFAMNVFSWDWYHFERTNWIYEVVGWVLLALATLATIERLITIKDNLFIKVGQNTLTIFIVHMILLYGSIIQLIMPFDLKKMYIGNFFYKEATYGRIPLNPLEAIIGAVLFVSIFVLIIKYQEQLATLFDRFISIIFPTRRRVRIRQIQRKIKNRK